MRLPINLIECRDGEEFIILMIFDIDFKGVSIGVDFSKRAKAIKSVVYLC